MNGLELAVGRWWVAAGDWFVQAIQWDLTKRWGYERTWIEGDLYSFGFGWFHVLVGWWPAEDRRKRKQDKR